MSLANITLPREPTDWGSAAQRTGEYFKCGPSEFSARYAPPVTGELPGGSPFKGCWLHDALPV